ncbi:MAG: energy transducer TonB [Cytophagales bacterium]|nr:energy transducer TonB [Cytophagales bacterium]
MKQNILLILLLVGLSQGYSQQIKKGQLIDYMLDVPVANAKISVVDTSLFVMSDSLGRFEIVMNDADYILIEAPGYRKLKVKSPENTSFTLHLVLLKPPLESQRFYSVVDESAHLENGLSLLEHILKSFQYWDRVKKEGITGRVAYELKIDEFGKAYDVRILKGVAPFVDEEVLRITKDSKWTPAVLENRNVKMKLSSSVSF